MTDTTSIAPDVDQSAGSGRPNGNLSTMLLPELKKVAHDMGLAGTSSMKKSDLVAAISAAQSGGARPAAEKSGRTRRPRPRTAASPRAAPRPRPRSAEESRGSATTSARATARGPARPSAAGRRSGRGRSAA